MLVHACCLVGAPGHEKNTQHRCPFRAADQARDVFHNAHSMPTLLVFSFCGWLSKCIPDLPAG